MEKLVPRFSIQKMTHFPLKKRNFLLNKPFFLKVSIILKYYHVSLKPKET